MQKNKSLYIIRKPRCHEHRRTFRGDLGKFIAKGFLHEYADMFHLAAHSEEIMAMEGFGEKSCQKLLQSIEAARHTTLPKLIYSLGIANIGLANAKVLCRQYDYHLEAMLQADVEELSAIDGIGEVIAASFHDYFKDEANAAAVQRLLPELYIEVEQTEPSERTLDGKVFVITGSLNHFENRNTLKDLIEKKAAK